MIVISGCTRDKAADDPGRLLHADFESAAGRRPDRERDLWHLSMPASQMYRGEEHNSTLAAVDELRASRGPRAVTHLIVSAGYGLLDENERIVPYDCSFDAMSPDAAARWAVELNLADDVRAKIRGQKSVAFILYSAYRRAIGPLAAEPGQRILWLDPDLDNLPFLEPLTQVPERRIFRSKAEDARFLRDFEAGNVPRGEWSHRALLRVACLLVHQTTPESALPRLRRGLIGLIGKGRYHETVAMAWLKILTGLSRGGRWPCPDAFMDEHPQILDEQYLVSFYSGERINVPDAATRFVEPDRRQFPT